MLDLFKYNSENLITYCKKNKISKLLVFGSYAKNTFTDDSDLDLLIEFESNKKPGYLSLARIQRELSEMLNKKVDLHTSEEISKYFRDTVIHEAIVQYAAE